jgi:hypothetical protein
MLNVLTDKDSLAFQGVKQLRKSQSLSVSSFQLAQAANDINRLHEERTEKIVLKGSL